MDAFEAGDLFADQQGAVFARPASGLGCGTTEVRFGKAAQVEEILQLRRLRQAQFRDRQRMQAKQVVAALERIASKAVEVQPRTSGDENLLPARAAIEQPLEEISPGAVLVELVEDPQLRGGQLATKNAFAMLGDIPVQVAGDSPWKALGESGLADLSRTRDEDHLLRQVATDLGREVTGERALPDSMTIFERSQKYSRVISP